MLRRVYFGKKAWIRTHNPKVKGSNPFPATKQINGLQKCRPFLFGACGQSSPTESSNRSVVRLQLPASEGGDYCYIWRVQEAKNARLRRDSGMRFSAPPAMPICLPVAAKSLTLASVGMIDVPDHGMAP